MDASFYDTSRRDILPAYLVSSASSAPRQGKPQDPAGGEMIGWLYALRRARERMMQVISHLLLRPATTPRLIML
jgi:hypothetical protein